MKTLAKTISRIGSALDVVLSIGGPILVVVGITSLPIHFSIRMILVGVVFIILYVFSE